nr:integrase, catalytic region, zinc finger, CCHC-type, peptidase aspartic, catalytic [Tanacetum cinerariifolium]
TPEVLIDFLRLVQRGLQAQVRVVRTDKGTEFLNQTLHAYFSAEGIQHQTSVARTSEQNSVVERQNRTLVEAARTMLSATKTMAVEHDSLSPGRKCQENVSHGDKTGSTSNELDLLFSPMFDELLNGSSKVVSKSSAVSAVDALNQRQQLTTPLNNHTTPAPTCQISSLAPTVISYENINQAEPHADNDQFADDEFINIFSTPVQEQGETSSRHVDSSNMHTFYQRFKNDVFDPDQVLKPLFPSPILVEDINSFLEKSDTSLSYSDISLPEYETFIDHTEETNSGSTTTHADTLFTRCADTKVVTWDDLAFKLITLE